jgi:hypothetical protein
MYNILSIGGASRVFVMLLFSSIQLVSQVCGLGDHATRGMSQI